jgi:hypothetical protein
MARGEGVNCSNFNWAKLAQNKYTESEKQILEIEPYT